MKKTVITILLVLPFVLIYFISFTGQVLSKYTHIYVERIVAVDEKGNEYEDGAYIKIGKDEVYDLNIKIFPELATDKRITISNSDTEVCAIDNETHKVTGLKYGTSRVIITSVDRHYVQYIVYIVVADEEIEDIVPNKTAIELSKGKSEYIDVAIVPTTTAPENRYLIWSSADTNIATVKNGYITGVGAGTTTITVKSKHKPEIFKEITVTVTNEYGEGVFFTHDNYNVIYAVNTTEFDLKTITVINLENVTINDVWYQLDNIPETGSVDVSNLSEGILNFNKEKAITIISVHAFDSEGNEYSDKIKIWYVQE